MAINLQTKVPLHPSKNPITYDSRVLLMGSCFVEHIGEKLEYFKFQTVQNPFGILFHTVALERLVEKALQNREYKLDEVFENNGMWYCFDAHSDLRGNSKAELLEKLNNQLKLVEEWLRTGTHIILTLGTAWVYEHIESKSIVANCHKVPQKEFSKKLLSAKQVESSLEKITSSVQQVNPKAQFIFTISPVRHLKDGFVENQQSKANLITGVHSLLASQGQSRNLHYFPAYEIMMDELRDYRFYEKDMVHPNALAVDYIWEKFKAKWIATECHELMDEVENIQKSLQHRPFNPNSEQHKSFQKALQTKIAYLQERLPFVKF